MLPFSRVQFFDAFAAYNQALWPVVVILWIASALSAVLLHRRNRRVAHQFMGALLAAQWAWSALAYHVAFFAAINPAAWLFAGLFLVQATLLWRRAALGRLRFDGHTSFRSHLAWALIAYSLAYPGINAIQHDSWSRIPTFGVPCPMTIFTVGALLLATPLPKSLAVVPIVWSVIGGSAAVLLGVAADYVLPLAGAALAFYSFAPHQAAQRAATGLASR